MNTRLDMTDRLYRAVAAWAKKNGGNIFVAGGVEVQKWGPTANHFTIGIKCLGTAPSKDAAMRQPNRGKKP